MTEFFLLYILGMVITYISICTISQIIEHKTLQIKNMFVPCKELGFNSDLLSGGTCFWPMTIICFICFLIAYSIFITGKWIYNNVIIPVHIKIQIKSFFDITLYERKK